MKRQLVLATMILGFGVSCISDWTEPTDEQCGDHLCGEGETCATCASDCGECPGECGDDMCDESETCLSCAADCGECATSCMGDCTCSDPTAGEGTICSCAVLDAAVQPPFEVVGTQISQEVETTSLSEGGEALYTFCIEEPGFYQVRLLVDAPDEGSNSLWVNMDDQPLDPTMIWDVEVTSGLEWRTVAWRGNGTTDASQFDPKEFILSEGSHTLVIRGREASLAFSELLIEFVGLPLTQSCTQGSEECPANADCVNSDGVFRCACGAGYELQGSSCHDVDECIQEMDDCHQHADCTNTEGSFTCICQAGYDGDGWTCEGTGPGPACGPPAGPENTGLLDPSLLTAYTGSHNLSEGTHVIENAEIQGTLVIHGTAEVTIRNSHIYAHNSFYTIRVYESGTLLIEDSEIGKEGTYGERGLAGSNITARRVSIHHHEDGIKIGPHCLYETVWVHDLDTPRESPHSDAAQDDGGAHHAHFINCTLDALYAEDSRFVGSNESGGGNAAVIIKSDLGVGHDITFTNTYFNGGNYVFMGGDGGMGMPYNIVFEDCIVGPDRRYGISTLDADGLVWDVTEEASCE